MTVRCCQRCRRQHARRQLGGRYSISATGSSKRGQTHLLVPVQVEDQLRVAQGTTCRAGE